MPDVVITTLLNAVPDPQRGTHIGADVGLLGPLRESVHAHDRRLVVLHDCLDEPDDHLTSFVRVPPGGNPYWYRWRCIANYLEWHSEHFNVWCVDGTDVEMLADPFAEMRWDDDRLFVGSEDKTLGDPRDGDTQTWLRSHCPSLAWWYDANPDLQVLNVGLVGGARAEVLHLAEMIADWEASGDDYEMGIFNWLVRNVWARKIVTGHPVHTPFLRYERTRGAWWRHK